MFNSFNTLDRIYNLQNYVGKTIIAIWFNFNNGYTFNGTCSPMILNGISTSTDFIKYEQTTQLISLGSIELAKIGDYTDRIFKDNGKWYLYEETGYAIVTGSSTDNVATWSAPELTNTIGFRILDLPNVIVNTNASKVVPVLCNRLKENSQGYLYSNDVEGIGIYAQSGIIYLRIAKTIATTVEGLKTWFQSNNMTICYPLQTPTTTEITDTTLIAQLENILAMHTNKNVSNVWIEPSGTNAQGGLTLTYRQDLQTLTDKISNLEARISLLE